MNNLSNVFFHFGDNSENLKNKFKNLFYSIFHTYFFVFLFLLFAILFYTFINYIFKTNYDIFSVFKVTKNDLSSPFYIVVLYGPFIEEILFRLWLSLKSKDIIISMWFWLFLLMNGTFIELRISLILGGVFILISGIVYWGIQNIFINNSLSWTSYRSQFYLISLVSFSLIHMLNYEFFSLQFWVLLPVYLFPKFIIGFFITKLRLNYGFFWGLSFHIIINGISYLL